MRRWRASVEQPTPIFMTYCNNDDLFYNEKPIEQETLLSYYPSLVEKGEVRPWTVWGSRPMRRL
jgi:hypothetical protein